MSWLLRRIITTELRYIKQIKSKLSPTLNCGHVSRVIHQSAVCKTDKDVLIQIYKQATGSSELVREPKRKPYMKNLLLATLDKELIVYPQVLGRQRYIFLDEMCEAIETYFANEVDSNLIDREEAVPVNIAKDLKALGLYGLIIPQEYGGLGFTQTEFCKVAEAFATNSSISLSLLAHQCLAAKAIMDFGTEEQKNKYLPLMATGEKIGAFCFTEESGGTDPDCLKCRLSTSSHGDEFSLDGTKTWVTNGKIADIFVVIAKESVDGIPEGQLTAVIVDNRDKCVTIEHQPSLGMKAAQLAKVTFKEVLLNNDDVLGERRAGLQIAVDVYNYSKIGVGAMCTGMSKHLIEMAITYANNREMYDMKMSDLASVREEIGDMSARTCAIEAFTYFVASLEDQYDGQDYSVESSCLKVRATAGLRQNVDSCVKILASRALDSDFPYERHLRDSIALCSFLGTNDVTELVIALDCLQYCGNNMSTLILKKRRLLEHPKFNLKNLLRDSFQVMRKSPNFHMKLNYYLHPTLEEEAKDTERIIVYLSYGIEKALVYFGSKVASEQHQFITSRMGSCTSTVMMLLAALSRASRSTCLGLPHAQDELTSVMILYKLYGHVANHYIAEIFNGMDNLDINKVNDFSVQVVNGKKYNIKSPVYRSIW